MLFRSAAARSLSLLLARFFKTSLNRLASSPLPVSDLFGGVEAPDFGANQLFLFSAPPFSLPLDSLQRLKLDNELDPLAALFVKAAPLPSFENASALVSPSLDLRRRASDAPRIPDSSLPVDIPVPATSSSSTSSSFPIACASSPDPPVGVERS